MNLNGKESAELVVLNFSGVYETETFYKKYHTLWVDLKDIQGTNCYCDQEAEEEIKERLRNIAPDGVHFIDSGNCHYASKIWIDKLKEEFELLVFDHHTDMQAPVFGDILSCGGWIKTALDSNPLLKKVYLMGPPLEEARKIEEAYYNGRLVWLDEERLKNPSLLRECLGKGGPGLYISIDKDILSSSFAVTNWDQGNTELEVLLACMEEAAALRRIIGIDICGENPENSDYSEIENEIETNTGHEAAANDRTNDTLASRCLKLFNYIVEP